MAATHLKARIFNSSLRSSEALILLFNLAMSAGREASLSCLSRSTCVSVSSSSYEVGLQNYNILATITHHIFLPGV